MELLWIQSKFLRYYAVRTADCFGGRMASLVKSDRVFYESTVNRSQDWQRKPSSKWGSEISSAITSTAANAASARCLEVASA